MEYFWDDTFGQKCHWSPHPDQHPGTHDKLQEVFPAHLGDTQIKFTLALADFKQITHVNSNTEGNRINTQKELLTLKLTIVTQFLVSRLGYVMYNLSTEWDS